ncbi:hypothetical protein M405DRAFT_486980 [Rhizopogon salebrosus TDB-379]|nr:hypothetical protein M405DRAFT_486980 [Rhizopogon salebrosus TDB-379]
MPMSGNPLSMYVRTHYTNVLDELLTPTSVATTTLIMNWCSEATLISSFMTRADSKLEVKMKQFVSERASARELNECIMRYGRQPYP